MTDKSEEEKISSQPATDAGTIGPDNQDRWVSDVNPMRDRKKTNKGDRKNGSIATRFKKGKSGNPKGRPKKVATDPDTGPGDILQEIDNEVVVVMIDGKRRRVTKAVAHFLQLFEQSSKEDLKAAKLLFSLVVRYFRSEPEGEGLSQTHFFILPDDYYYNPEAYKNISLDKIGRWHGPPPQVFQQPLAVSYLFRKVASEEVVTDVCGTRAKMTRLQAFVRGIYEMAQSQNMEAAKLLEQIRKKFPGQALPGEPNVFYISEADARA